MFSEIFSEALKSLFKDALKEILLRGICKYWKLVRPYIVGLIASIYFRIRIWHRK